MKIPYVLAAIGAAASIAAAVVSARQPDSYLVVKKSDKSISLHYDGRQFGPYPIALGKNCQDLRAKRLWADGCTTEGRYRVLTKFRRDGSLHKVVISDYPSPMEVAGAAYLGKVSPSRLFPYFRSRLSNLFGEHDMSFAGTELGSFSIHGDRMRESGADWTPNGSAAMNNEDIDIIFPLVTSGTEIRIEK